MTSEPLSDREDGAVRWRCPLHLHMWCSVPETGDVCRCPETLRAALTVPEFPAFADGRTLTAMRVSTEPERFVYGEADTLGWLRERLERASVALDEQRPRHSITEEAL